MTKLLLETMREVMTEMMIDGPENVWTDDKYSSYGSQTATEDREDEEGGQVSTADFLL